MNEKKRPRKRSQMIKRKRMNEERSERANKRKKWRVELKEKLGILKKKRYMKCIERHINSMREIYK